MHVSELMTACPITVTPATSLDSALAMMEQHRIRHLPVVQDAELVGILSDRDMLETTAGLPLRVHAAHGRALPSAKTVDAIMHSKVVSVSPDDTIATAAVDLLHYGIGCVPVVRGKRLLGILSEMDLLEAIADERMHAGAEGGTCTVSSKMTGTPTTIAWATSISEAANLCRANGIRHLIVEERGVLVGIVSDRDLRRAVGAGRHADTTVDEILTNAPVSTSPDATMVDAAKTMLARRISCLPVVDANRVVGILTASDVIDHCLDSCQGRRESAKPIES